MIQKVHRALPHVRTQWEGSSYAPGRQPSPEHDHASSSILHSAASRTSILQELRGTTNPICSHSPWFWMYGPHVLKNWNNLHIGSLTHGSKAIMDFMMTHYTADMLREHTELGTTSSLYFGHESTSSNTQQYWKGKEMNL